MPYSAAHKRKSRERTVECVRRPFPRAGAAAEVSIDGVVEVPRL